LEQLRGKIRQAESDRKLAVNKAKLLQEELTSQQTCKGHEDKLRQLEDERELERQREEVQREQAQLVEQHKLLKHQMEMTKQQHERELLKKS